MLSDRSKKFLFWAGPILVAGLLVYLATRMPPYAAAFILGAVLIVIVRLRLWRIASWCFQSLDAKAKKKRKAQSPKRRKECRKPLPSEEENGEEGPLPHPSPSRQAAVPFHVFETTMQGSPKLQGPCLPPMAFQHYHPQMMAQHSSMYPPPPSELYRAGYPSPQFFYPMYPPSMPGPPYAETSYYPHQEGRKEKEERSPRSREGVQG